MCRIHTPLTLLTEVVVNSHAPTEQVSIAFRHSAADCHQVPSGDDRLVTCRPREPDRAASSANTGSKL
jgi:hypothetical protein